MTYDEWEAQVPYEIKRDPVWKPEAYRNGPFLGDLAWPDSGLLLKERRTWSVADQLYRAAGSISTNICEGFSRGTGRDRKRFYEYALGSASESRDWYYKSRFVLGDDVNTHRIKMTSSIAGLLVAMIRTEHRRSRIEPGDSTSAED